MIIMNIVSPLSSAALILEEIAIDSPNKEEEHRLLREAEDLHLASLALAKKAFGENNVQTAKHYGNLGRLYQSMKRYSVSRAGWVCLGWRSSKILKFWLKPLV